MTSQYSNRNTKFTIIILIIILEYFFINFCEIRRIPTQAGEILSLSVRLKLTIIFLLFNCMCGIVTTSRDLVFSSILFLFLSLLNSFYCLLINIDDFLSVFFFHYFSRKLKVTKCQLCVNFSSKI